MIMAKQDYKIYQVTNPIFLENKQGFISKEPGVQDLGEEPVFQRIFGVPEASSGTRGGIVEALGANNTGDRDGSIDTAGTGGIGGAGGAEDDAGDDAEDNTSNVKNNVSVENKAEAEDSNITSQSSQNSGLTNQRLEVAIPTHRTPSLGETISNPLRTASEQLLSPLPIPILIEPSGRPS
jgi:hypothetical protein